MKIKSGLFLMGLMVSVVACGAGKAEKVDERGEAPVIVSPGANSGLDGKKLSVKDDVVIPTIEKAPFDFPEPGPLPEPSVATVDPKDAVLTIVYKDDFYASHVEGNPGANDQGYDTKIFRFYAPPKTETKAFTCATMAELRPDGEREAERLILDRSTEMLIATSIYPTGDKSEFHIVSQEDIVSVWIRDFETHESNYYYAFEKTGELSSSYKDTDKKELTRLWSEKHGGVSMIANCDGKGTPAYGRFEGGIAKPTRYIERPSNEPGGGADLEINLRYRPDGLWIKTDHVEPVNECMIVGLEAWFRDGNPLERLAILEMFLSGTSDLEPVLFAAALSARKSP